MSTHKPLGNLVRLSGLSVKDLPSHSALVDSSDSTDTRPTLQHFVSDILSQSLPFIDNVAPKHPTDTPSPWRHKFQKSYTSSTAPVDLLEHVILAEDLAVTPTPNRGETWFCRRSIHDDKSAKGTASWAEFDRYFRVEHAQTENAFTPTVLASREVIRWDTAGMVVRVNGEEYGDVQLYIVEMSHKMPWPMKNRTFPILQLSASLLPQPSSEFIVVSVTVRDLHSLPDSTAKDCRDPAFVVGTYASVERIRKMEDKIEWLMATAGDVGGSLPKFVENLAVPRAIAKDVEMFLKWVVGQRENPAA